MLRHHSLLLAASLVMAGCGDSTGPSVPTMARLEGAWHGTSLTITAYADPTRVRQRFDPTDIIAQHFTIQGDGSYGRTDTYAWLPTDFIDSGTVVIHADSVIFQSQFGAPYGFPKARLRDDVLVLQDSVFGYFDSGSLSQESLHFKWTLQRD